MKLLPFIRRALLRAPASAEKNHSWKIAGCSRPGTAHVRRGRTCEDAVDWFAIGEMLSIAVADGAGSAAHPAIGSALVVTTALNTLRNHYSNSKPIDASNATHLLGHACQTSLNTIAAKAEEMGVDPRDLASTLIVVVANRNFCAAAQIGDGAVVLKSDSGDLVSLATPTNGEFANETILLGCVPAIDVQVSSLTDFPIRSIAVITDGLQRLALRMPQCDPHAPFFMPLFDRLQQLTESEMESLIKDFLDSARVNNRTDDDKSLVTAQLL